MRTGEPFSAKRAGCGGAARISGNRTCGGRVAWVGVKYFPYPQPVLFRAFACDEHVDALDVARPLDEAGRSHLEERRERHRRVVEDRVPYEPEAPLAVGVAARRRLEHTRAVAGRHPGWRAR